MADRKVSDRGAYNRKSTRLPAVPTIGVVEVGCREAGLKDSTIRRRAEPLAAIVTCWFMDHGVTRLNPFTRLGFSVRAEDDRLPFHTRHLEKIDTYLRSGAVKPKLAQIMRIMRGTTGGPAEIAGIAVADVFLDADVPHVWIRANAMRGLKVKARERCMPLVGDALAAMREAMVAPVGVGVFYNPLPEPRPKKPAADHFDKTRPSTFLNTVLHNAGIPHPSRLSCNSFRHSMKQALVQAGEDLARYLMGHSGGLHHRYGSPTPLLLEARDALTAAVALLGHVDLSIYRSEERLPS